MVSFAEGTFPNGGFWFGGDVCAQDYPISLLYTFGTDSDGSVWDVGAIVKWRWHVFVALLYVI